MGPNIDRYDASETDDRPKSSTITKKQLVLLFVVFFVIVMALSPIYRRMMDERDTYVCKMNLADISKALFLYAEENTGRFPPTHVTDYQWSPRLFQTDKGSRVHTWLSLVSGFLKDPKNGTRCPSSSDTDVVPTEGPDGETMHTSYGLFGAISGVATSNMEDASLTAIISETCNQGSSGTYDPKPFKDADGLALPDGFSIGLDTTNFDPVDQRDVLEGGLYATRLAYPNSKGPKFSGDGPSKHPFGIHYIFADGHIKMYGPKMAVVNIKAAHNPWRLQ